jgi:hypothetical protein
MRRQVSEYESEVRTRMNNYEQSTVQLKRDNEELLKKRTENEGRIALLSQ